MSTVLLPQHKICTNTARNDRVKEGVFVHSFMIKSLKFPWKLGAIGMAANSHPPYLIVISFFASSQHVETRISYTRGCSPITLLTLFHLRHFDSTLAKLRVLQQVLEHRALIPRLRRPIGSRPWQGVVRQGTARVSLP